MKILATGIDTLEVGYEVDQFRDEIDLDCLKLFKNYAIEDRKKSLLNYTTNNLLYHISHLRDTLTTYIMRIYKSLY